MGDDRFEKIYKGGGGFLEATQGTWHSEDSPWKALQVRKMIEKHHLQPRVIGEVGCGAGVVLHELSVSPGLKSTQFIGYDISDRAIEMAKALDDPPRLRFKLGDPLDDPSVEFDILLALDVFEHVPDYLGFLEKCQRQARHKIYHIPLDVNAASVVRNLVTRHRYTLGHLHYFDEDSALNSLRDTDHEVIDYFYTSGALELFGEHPGVKTGIGNVLRWIVSKLSVRWSARLFGGYSLLVLCR